MRSLVRSILALAVIALAAPSTGRAVETAKADLIDANGTTIGSARLTAGPQGVLIEMRVQGLPEGTHGFHIHETGKCDAPSFDSAGGHFNPDHAKHGLLNAAGPHAGDLPNIQALGFGRLIVEMMADDVTLKEGEQESLLDADGSALVIHADRDDLKTDPSGNSGARIACGVIQR